MLVVFLFYYTVRKFVKSKKAFAIISATVFVAASVIHAFPAFYSWGYFRAFSAMSAGLLISLLPSLKLKKPWLIWLPLTCVCLLVLKMLLFNFTFAEEELLDLILYPALIYLAFQISVSNKFFNYLGALSFGLYAYQSIPRFITKLGYDNVWVSFLIIAVSAVLTDLIKRLVKRKKLLILSAEQ